jgi:DNA-binding transcriptional LysR family regulator
MGGTPKTSAQGAAGVRFRLVHSALGRFLTRHPDIDLAIESSSRNVDFELEAFNAGISVGDARSKG